MTETTRRTFNRLGLLLPALSLLPRPAGAADGPVRVGCPYPLSGNAASAGQSTKTAIEVAVDIINNPHPELGKLTLAATAGLPGLGGRKLETVFADHQGNPATAQSETMRLITQEKVVALAGAYQSSCTLTASAAAERYGIPFMAPESAATNLTERGFKWFFRASPTATGLAAVYSDFLIDLKGKGTKVDQVAIVNENTEFGTSTGDAIIKALNAKNLKTDLRIPYNANSTDVSSQVLQLKGANPDVVIFISYTSDAILFIKTMHNLGYKPPVMIGEDAGFSDASFVTAVSDLAQGAINRSSFDPGKPGSVPYLVNAMFRRASGRDMDDTSARGMQGFLALIEAINRAGSTEPAKIQAALQSQDLKPDQLMIGYKGIKYDDHGQNTLASTLLVQLDGKKYVAVWPDSSAVQKLTLPFKGWD